MERGSANGGFANFYEIDLIGWIARTGREKKNHGFDKVQLAFMSLDIVLVSFLGSRKPKSILGIFFPHV